jgi:large subunit ribosomal protein L24
MARSSGKFKIRKGDTVEVIAGKDKGRRGTVERVLPAQGRVVVEGINIVKRHTKPRPSTNPNQAARQQPTGGVIEKPAALHISNVAIVSPGSSNKPSRVGYRWVGEGDEKRKVRVARRDGVDLDETKGK